MIFRKTRLVLILIFTANLLVLFYYRSSRLIHEVEKNSFLYKVKASFDKNIIVPWKNRQSDNADIKRMSLLSTDVTNVNNVVTIPKEYLTETEGLSFEEELKRILMFDPRLTNGLLLHYLTKAIQKDKSIDNLEIPYFHWSDHVNLSKLEDNFKNPKKTTCKSFTIDGDEGKRADVTRDHGLYCFEDTQVEELLTNPNSSKALKENIMTVKDRKFTTGFHIWRDGGRSTKQNKIIQAKVYLFDYMPPPLSVVLLLPPKLNTYKGMSSLNNAIQIKVNQNTNKKLIHSDLLESYAKEKRFKGTQDLKLNVKQEIEGFMKQLKKIKYQKEVPIQYERHLVHESFIDNSTETFIQLDPGDNLHFQSYKKSLELSLNTKKPPKYFSEAKLIKEENQYVPIGAHYDWRFFNGVVHFTEDQPSVLYAITKAWIQFVNSYNMNGWISHGSLLGWYWNGMTLPWDEDMDVQMPIQELHYVCKHFNQTLVMDLGNEFGTNQIRYSKYYLDCGTFISHRTDKYGRNRIDARFIDVNTGVYVDITGLSVTDGDTPGRYDSKLPEKYKDKGKVDSFTRNNHLKAYNCKNNHFSTLEELSPMKLSFFEGQLNYVPNDYKTILINEYTDKCFTKPKHQRFSWAEKLRLWVNTQHTVEFIKRKYPELEKKLNFDIYYPYSDLGQKNPGTIITQEQFKDEDFIDYLMEHKNVLFEFLISQELTEFHKIELEKLEKGESTKDLLFTGNKVSKSFNTVRPDFFTFKGFLDFENDKEALKFFND